MRWVTRQHALLAAVAAIGFITIGCDSKEADRKAVEQFERGDYKAAAKEGSNPLTQTLAASKAADQDLAAALPSYRDLNAAQLRVSDALFSLDRLAAQANLVSNSAASLAKLNPQTTLTSIDTTVQQVKGDGQQTWAPAGSEVQMPTIAATSARANQLKDQIAEIERNLSALQEKHDAAAAQSMKLMGESQAATGEKAVDLYKQSADAKQQGENLTVQIEQVNATLLPLKQELAVVQDQNQLATQAVDILSGEREDIQKSWRGITAQAEQRAALAAGIYGKAATDKTATVLSQAARLAEVSGDQTKLQAQYQDQLKAASASAKEAVNGSVKAVKDFGEGRLSSAKVVTPAQLVTAALDPSAARFTEAYINFSLGTSLGMQASIAGSQAKVLANVSDVAKSVGQKLPDGLDVDTAKKQQAAAGTDAAEALKAAAEQFGVVSEANVQYADTNRAASTGRMLALAASSTVFQTQGDAASAKQAIDEAKAIRDKLLEAGNAGMPSLPPSLEDGAASAPATAPAAAGGVEKQ